MGKRRKEDRLREIWAWLLTEFPVRRPATLKVKRIDKGHQGYVLDGPDGIEVCNDATSPLWAQAETLIHECAHVRSKRVKHGPQFLAVQYEIEEAFWRWRKSV